jgi:hypothetical protein
MTSLHFARLSQPSGHQEQARQYLAPRLAARAQGHRLGRPESELELFSLDFGGNDHGREVRRLRQQARSCSDEYSVPFQQRVFGHWGHRTYDALLSALTECTFARENLRVHVGESAGAAGWDLWVPPSWIATVHARGMAVVEGSLTLSVRRYTHPLPGSAEAYYAEWASGGPKGLVIRSGALYRYSRDEAWRHAKLELSAIDRLLGNEPVVVPPKRTRQPIRFSDAIVRTGLSQEELQRVRAAARRSKMTLSQWSKAVLVRASTPPRGGAETSGGEGTP